MGKGTEGARRATGLVRNRVNQMLRRVGGGNRKVIEIRSTSPELLQARNGQKGAEAVHELSIQRLRELEAREQALLNKSRGWKNPNSSGNQKKLQDASNATRDAANRAITASQKSRRAREAFLNTKKQVTNDALRQVRNKGIKRLSGVGLAGALGVGTYSTFSGNSSPEAQDVQETPQQYIYDPNNGWQEYNDETKQYENQQPGFGVDQYGNTNYYDGQNWLTPEQYLQGSNGYIYNKQTGQIIGIADDTMEAYNSGYNNVFDYRASKAGYTSPAEVKELQTRLGIKADGKWGKQTQDAFNRAAQNWAQQYDPNSLFSIYQRKMQYGY